MIIDTIKLIACELADMSPKTQLEIVKLCKNMCLAVKDYLVENDETIEDINTYIENLQTAVSNLNGAIAELTSELSTAESNITANANAILTIQDSITALQTAISNVYTKTEIDTMLASIYTKSEVNTLLLDYYKKAETYSKTEIDTMLSLYYTMIQVNELLSGKLNASDVCFITIENRYTPVSEDDFNKMYASKLGVIFYNGYKYYYTSATVDVQTDVTTLNFNAYVVEDGISKLLALPSNTKLINPIDTDVAQPILVSGTNIKTINGVSILGAGDLVVGGSAIYQHNIYISSSTNMIGFTALLFNTSATPFTKTTFGELAIAERIIATGVAYGLNLDETANEIIICEGLVLNGDGTLYATGCNSTYTNNQDAVLIDLSDITISLLDSVYQLS